MFPFNFEGPKTTHEDITFANGNAYVWGYTDAAAKFGSPVTIPNGFAFAWLEYVRTHASRMSVQGAFKVWCETGTLPDLDGHARVA